MANASGSRQRVVMKGLASLALMAGCFPLAPGCVSIDSTTPEPAVAGQKFTLRVSNIIGPASLESNVRVTLDGQEVSNLLLGPGDRVGFVVPESTIAGCHLVEVYDPLDTIEIATLLFLLRDRTDERVIDVAAPPVVVDLIPATLSGEDNQDSEPFLSIHRGNPALMVASAFTPSPGGVSSTTAPIFLTENAGRTWSLVESLPSPEWIFDITHAFDGDSPSSDTGRLYAGIINADEDHYLQALTTDDATSNSPMSLLNEHGQYLNADQPYVQVDSHGGTDRVYVGNNDFDVEPRTATVDFSEDGGANWVSLRIEARDPNPRDGPSVRPAVGPGGVVYAAFLSRTGIVGSARITDVVVVRDDNGGASTTPFRDLLDSADGLPGQRVVRGATIPSSSGLNDMPLGQERIGSTLTLTVDPRNSATVYIAWCDRVGTGDIYSIHVRRSVDSGQTWSGSDLRTITNATNVSLAIAGNGTVGMLYQQLDSAGTANERWTTHLEQTRDEFRTFQDTVLATTRADVPYVQFWPYLGDYTCLLVCGNSFRGVFSASNEPQVQNFPQGVVYQRVVDFDAHMLFDGSGNRVSVSIDPFFFSVQVMP